MSSTATLRVQLTVGRLIRKQAIRAIKGFAWKYQLACEIEQVDGILESDLYVKLRGGTERVREAQRNFNSFYAEELA